MKLKRALAMMIPLSLTAAISVPVSAAERITSVIYEANEDFENYAGTGAPAGWTAYGVWDSTVGGVYTPEPERCEGNGGGTGIKIGLNDHQWTAGIKKNIEKLRADENLDISFDVKVNSSTAYPVIRLTGKYLDGKSDYDARIAFINGEIKTSDKAPQRRTVGSYDYTPGEWFNVKMRINGKSSAYSIWVNGTESVHNGVYARDGGEKFSGSVQDFGESTSYQNLIADSTDILLGGYQEGEFCFDNISVKKSAKDTNVGSGAFFTDFSDMTPEYGILPDGFMLPSNYWGIVGAEKDAEHGMSLVLNGVNRSALQYVFDEPITSGTVTCEFDAYNEGARVLFEALGIDKIEYLIKDYECVWMWIKSSMSSAEDNATDKWEHYTVTVDIDNQTYTIVCDGTNIASGVYDKSKVGSLCIRALNVNDKGNPVYIDNFKCIAAPASSYQRTEDDFEGYSDVTGVLGTWSKEGWSKTDEMLDEENGNKYFSVNGTKGGAYNRTFNEITSGIVHVEADVRVTGNTQALILSAPSAGSDYQVIALFDGSAGVVDMGAWATDDYHKISNISKNEWYKVKSDTDFMNKTLTTAVSADGGESWTSKTFYFDELGSGAGMTGINKIKLQVNGNDNSSGYAQFDNILITQKSADLYDTPEVTLYGAEGEQIAASDRVTPAISKISVDFGAPMNTASLLDAVSLTDGGGAEAGYFAVPNGQILNIILTNILKANESYTLRIDGSAQSSAGISLGNAFEQMLETGDNVFSARNFKMAKDGGEINSMGDITGGMQASFGFSYINTLSSISEVYLITAYYKDKALINTNYKLVGIDDDIRCAYVSILENIDDPGDADTFKVFLWSGESHMIPLTDNIEIR
ncbi:MAG: hypothetical protein J6N52_07145 [Clostridia bacterium]|nr:hypothetical protein [Clostridia bacterium]